MTSFPSLRRDKLVTEVFTLHVLPAKRGKNESTLFTYYYIYCTRLHIQYYYIYCTLNNMIDKKPAL